MADFATLGAVEVWIKAERAAGRIVNGYSERESNPGSTTNLAGRVQIPQKSGAPEANNGGWVTIYDDAQVS